MTWVICILILVRSETVNLGAKLGHSLPRNISLASKSFLLHPLELIGVVGHVQILVCLETVLISVHTWETNCLKHATGFEIIFARLLELIGDVGLVQSKFGPFG